jgi:hypothetical protein
MTERFHELGRERADQHRQAVTSAVHELLTLIDERGFEIDDYTEKANAILSNVPDRHRAEFDGILEELSVSADELAVYMFALADITSDLTGGDGGGEECTNAIVDASRSAHGVPLVLKNRDISADGLRPQAILETPPIDGYHGFLTVTTACSAFVFQGVNDAGLVAANTFVDRAREDVDPADRLRNGVLVRRILEECDTVADARALVEAQPVELSKGLTLSLADEAEAQLLEIDPRSATIRALDGDVIPRTNHFPAEGDGDDDSSAYRLKRSRELVSDFDERVSTDDLFDVATDHRNGPGPNSICRHAVNEHNDPHALSQSTTVSTSVYRGGTPAVDVVVGNPCESSPHRYRMRTEAE